MNQEVVCILRMSYLLFFLAMSLHSQILAINLLRNDGQKKINKQNHPLTVSVPSSCMCVCERLRGVQNVGGLGVPAGEPVARSMWEEEGVGWASSPVRGSQRGPTIRAAVGL